MCLLGITPACAGKRAGQPRISRGFGDHPRMRGEKSGKQVCTLRHQGSPPHARGKAVYRRGTFVLVGITPACAGKRSPVLLAASQSGDHPRMRGEKSVFGFSWLHSPGSPPHARGKARSCSLTCSTSGITPACAGKRLKHIHYLLYSCAKHLFTPQFCVDDLCHLAVSHSTVPLYIR